MAQNEKFPKTPTFFGDMTLTAVAVAVVALTYFGVSGLTPKATSQLASSNSAVLGVTSKQRALTYFPAKTDQLPYVKNYKIEGNTGLEGNAIVQVTFAPLEASTYEFTVVTIKNTSNSFKKVQFTPGFSLDGSYTTISMTYGGLTTEVVSSTGTLTPLDLVVPPSTSSEVTLRVQPTVKLATPVTLALVFTEVP